MSTRMNEEDWAHTLEVFRACLPRRWTKAGDWDRIMDAITEAYGGDVRMSDGTSVRVHHSAATLKKATRIDVLDDQGAVLLRKSML
jgi:transposase